MNKVDIENIKKELNKRKAAEYKFESGGDLSQSDIINATTENLDKMKEDFFNSEKGDAAEKIKKIVDEIFEKYGNENDNIIILGACNYYDDLRCVSISDNPLEDIDFEGFDHKYNKLAYPIGRNYDLHHYDEHKHNYVNGKDDSMCNELLKRTMDIEFLLPKLGLSSIEDYWNNDNDAINECWYGVHAITKNYKIVTFVIREDGMLCDEGDKCFNSFHNKTLYTI